MTSELTKTSLLIVSSVFTAAGAAILTVDIVKGSILLLIAVGVLVLRGYLKKKGYEIEAANKPAE